MPYLECPICEREFYKRPCKIKLSKTHCCSKECMGILKTGSNNHAWKGGKKQVRCVECGKTVTRKQHRNPVNSFCSVKCRSRHYKGEANPRFIQVKKECIYCNNSFQTIRQKYCSRVCADKAHAINIIGDNNPNWREGIGKLPYPYEFNEELKTRIKERDDNKCRICYVNEEDSKILYGAGLTVHHVDYDKNNNSENNLVTLCCACHGLTGYNRDSWTQLFRNLLMKKTFTHLRKCCSTLN